MLNEKDQQILRTIIQLYVGDGVPVSSQRVKDAGRYSFSPATIRNRMASLERQGFIAKPHTSAGRVPTDEGYRYYVDWLTEEQVDWEAVAQRCHQVLWDEYRDASQPMLLASQLLGDLSKNFAVVYGSLEQESRVKRIRLVRLEGERLLVVVNLEPEHERTAVVGLDREFDGATIADAEASLNRDLNGKTMEQAKGLLEGAVRDNVTDEGLIRREILLNRELIFSEPDEVELYFEERGHLLEQPELSDPKVLQSILRLTHNKPYLTSILSGRHPDRIQVTIGAEHDDAELRPFSLITAGYRMGAARGVLGIIGPTRMRYDLGLALVGAVSRELRAIGEAYF